MSNKNDILNKDYNELSNKAMLKLLSNLAAVEDPRGQNGRLHIFTDILAILIFATVCGCDNAEKFSLWGKKEEPWLRKFLILPNGIPSHDTFLRALSRMNPVSFRTAFLSWEGEIFEMMGLKGQISIDGKSLKGANKSVYGKTPVKMVMKINTQGKYHE
jgi:hypothetical protein